LHYYLNLTGPSSSLFTGPARTLQILPPTSNAANITHSIWNQAYCSRSSSVDSALRLHETDRPTSLSNTGSSPHMAIGHLEMESCPWNPLLVRGKRIVHQQRVEGSDGLPVVTTIGRCIAPTPPIQVQVCDVVLDQRIHSCSVCDRKGCQRVRKLGLARSRGEVRRP